MNKEPIKYTRLGIWDSTENVHVPGRNKARSRGGIRWSMFGLYSGRFLFQVFQLMIQAQL